MWVEEGGYEIWFVFFGYKFFEWSGMNKCINKESLCVNYFVIWMNNKVKIYI